MRNKKQIAKQVHRTLAAALLDRKPVYRWLMHKTEILDELGKIEADYALMEIAKRICELKPATAAAIDMIRRHREFDELADEIIHVVKDYCRRRPATSRIEILSALETTGLMLGKPTENEPAGRHQFLRKLDTPTDSAEPAAARKSGAILPARQTA